MKAQDSTHNEKLFKELLERAKEVAKLAYAPYSRFPVGAAIISADGKVFTGCNVENASLPVGICAEVCAIGKAVSEGVRNFKAIAVYCDLSSASWPCGRCRQFISEFGADIVVITQGKDSQIETKTMQELLPGMFGPGDMTDLLNSP